MPSPNPCSRPRRLATLAASLSTAVGVAIALSACGGGGDSSGPSTQTNSQTDTRVTLAQYQASRNATPAAAPRAAQVTAADLAPLLADLRQVETSVPPLRASLRNWLLQASRGETQAEVSAQLSDLQAWAAPVVERSMGAPAAMPFNESFLRQTDVGTASASLRDWRALEQVGPLRVTDQALLSVAWPSSSKLVRGLLQAENGEWSTADLLELQAPAWRLDGSGWQADGISLANGQHLVALRPISGSLAAFVDQGLADALLTLINAPALPQAAPASRVMLPLVQQQSTAAPLPAGLTRPFDSARSDLKGIDGVGGKLTYSRGEDRLDWKLEGLQLSALQTLEYEPHSGGGQFAAVFTNNSPRSFLPPACPAGPPDLGPRIWLWLDAQRRVIAASRLAFPGSNAAPCTRD